MHVLSGRNNDKNNSMHAMEVSNHGSQQHGKASIGMRQWMVRHRNEATGGNTTNGKAMTIIAGLRQCR